MKKVSILLALLIGAFSFGSVQAKSFENLRWQTAATIQAKLGSPISKKGPVGTVRQYQLWSYDGYLVAFTNGRVTHVFDWPSTPK